MRAQKFSKIKFAKFASLLFIAATFFTTTSCTDYLKELNVNDPEITVNDPEKNVNDPEVNDPEVNDPERKVNDPEVNDPE